MCPEWLGDTAPEQFWQRLLSVGYFAKCATPPTPKRKGRKCDPRSNKCSNGDPAPIITKKRHYGKKQKTPQKCQTSNVC